MSICNFLSICHCQYSYIIIFEMYDVEEFLNQEITQSHGSWSPCCKSDTSSQWEKANLPLSLHPHPLTTVTKYCTRDYVHDISSQATFGQDRPRGYFSPYSQSYHSFFKNFFLSLYAKSFHGPRAQAVEPILTRDTPTDAYSRRVVPFGG